MLRAFPSAASGQDAVSLSLLIDLLEHEAQLAEERVESILAYVLGRTIEFSDSDDVEAISFG
jgi:hypothetical protein